MIEFVLVKILTFTVNGSVNGSLSSYCGRLFLAKPQVPITNNIDGVYDGAYFYLHIAAVCF